MTARADLDVVRDVRETATAWRLICLLAWTDLRARYRRSAIGPFWLTLGTALGTIGLGFVWSDLFKLERAVFVPAHGRQAALIRNLRLPLLLYPVQMVLKHAINLLHILPVFVVVALVYDVPFARTAWLVVPCALLVIANLLWITTLLSILGARFRDLEYLIAAGMPILMFLSPVFYRPSYLPVWEHLMWFNPFSHWIELVRSPMLGTLPPTHVVVTNFAMLVLGSGFTAWLFGAKRKRIPYWL